MWFDQWHTRFLKRFLFLLIPYSFLRIGFYFYHLGIYRQFHQNEIFESFLLGIRFDVAAICLINAPIVLLTLVPSTNKFFLKLERILFVLLNTAGIAANIDDFELFLFTGKRLAWDFFVITDDIWEQLPQVVLYYWYLPLAGLIFLWILFNADKKLFLLKATKPKIIKHTLGTLLLAGLAFVGIRGGLQHKSITVQSAFAQGKNELGHLVLNTPYHFLRTLKNQPLKKLSYFKTDDEAKNIILNYRDNRGGVEGVNRANVVLIILESFALEYIEEGYAPFLKELKEKALYFERHMANGRRSIESLPSLLCGLPSLLDEPISKSAFQSNKFSCMPKVLKDAGYTNHFYHGGTRGTMGFEAYTRANGFDLYFAREDYPDKKDDDGAWGIFDGPYLQYVAKQIDKMPSPFMVGVFTLSSHQPYVIPKELQGKFPKGSLEVHESIGYTDFALREFFNSIKDKHWFNKTLFIITADHSQKLDTKKFQNLVGHFQVPLIVYAPGYNWEGVNLKRVTQHSDIPMSVLDFVNIKTDGLPLTSNSIFSQDAGMGINYSSGATYFLVRDEKVLTLNKDLDQREFHYVWDTGEFESVGPSEDLILKAYLQYFVNGLINNNLSI